MLNKFSEMFHILTIFRHARWESGRRNRWSEQHDNHQSWGHGQRLFKGKDWFRIL